MSLGDDSSLTVEISDAVGDPRLDESGSALVQSEREGLMHVVEPVEGDVARILNVAEQSYSDSPLHEYAYKVTLPEGIDVVTLTDGTLAMVRDAEPGLGEAEAAEVLAATLPESALVDQAELAENEAPAEVLGDSSPDVPDGKVVVGGFQKPWAVDAAGNPLPTELTVDSAGVVVQHVDTTGAVFPVVSDPLPIIAIALGAAARALAPHVARAFVTQAIRVGASATTRGGFASFARFKAAAGAPRAGYQWHHIVEQSTIAKRGFNPYWIHNRNNMVQIPRAVHQKCVNSWMARKGVRSFGAKAASNQTMRQWVQGQSFSTQHRVGVNLLRHCGVKI
ncbi:hypothetical protein [Luteococcus sediminum]